MTTYRVSATAAVREFSELIRRVGDGGQEVVIVRHKKPVARISQVGFSPVRWSDFARHVRRTRQPDSNFLADLLRSRGDRGPAPSGSATLPLQAGTVLLDSSLLVGFLKHPSALHRLQRVATTAAALAELTQIAGGRGEFIADVRIAFLRRLASALPVISLTQEASLYRPIRTGAATNLGAVTGPLPATRPHPVFFALAAATARSIDWPIAGPGGLLWEPGCADP